MRKAFLLSIVFTVASIVVSIYFKSVAASLFSKTDLALFFTALDVVGLFMLLFIGFRASMTVAYNKGTPTYQILGIFRICVFVVSFVGLVFSVAVLPHMGLSVPVSYLLLLFLSFGLYTYFSNQLSMYRMYTDINVTTLLDPLTAVLWFFIFYYAVSVHSKDALFLSSIFGMLSVGGYIYARMRKNYPEPPFALVPLDDKAKSFISNSVFGGIEFVFGMLIIYLAVVFVGYNFSMEILGDFQVVVKSFFMYFIAVFVFPIVKFILPELSYLVAKKEFGAVKRLNSFALRYSLFAVAAVFVSVYLFSKPVIVWLFGESYMAAKDALLVLSIAIFFVSMNTYQVALLKSLDKFFLSMSVRAIGSFVFPIFAFLTHLFSPTLESVSAALVLSYGSMAAISYYFSRREVAKIST